MKEYWIYLTVKAFGSLIRHLPLGLALLIGRWVGILAYYFDIKHKSLAYSNLKVVFSKTRSPNEIKRITKKLFQNYGQNLIEIFRLPLVNQSNFEQFVQIEGKENLEEGLKQNKGLILLAMHFGSWELASLACAMFNHPYKVIVKFQKKFSHLDRLLNSYRTGNGSVVISRGLETREFLKSLKNNEIIGMVMDQGGKDGRLVPFFGRGASMSIGAIRTSLKLGVPICFCIIIRKQKAQHRMIIHRPLELERTGNLESDIEVNLKKITKMMEGYILEFPHEYMWFYKIWKYSKESTITILNDGRLGHLRQSQCVAKMIEKALGERQIVASVETVDIYFKSQLRRNLFSLISALTHPFFYQGRLEFLKWFLIKESFKAVMSFKADFIISCGAMVASVNHFISKDLNAKSIVLQRPGVLNINKFDLVILPQHDMVKTHVTTHVAMTKAAPNLITEEYLEEQTKLLTLRYTHLKAKQKLTLGVLLGGDAKNLHLTEGQVKLLVAQLKEIVQELDAHILLTTSRRTPLKIEQYLLKEFKKHERCPLLILSNQNNIPEAVGGILGLSDIVIVSGDSISMVSEAASSGKKIIVFPVEYRRRFFKRGNKHKIFIEKLHSQGYILAPSLRNLGEAVLSLAKNKIHTKRLDDREIILEAVRKVI